MSAPTSSAFFALLSLLGLAAPSPVAVQGYVEAEYVLVSPQLSGTLETLAVARGETVQAGQPLFTLERGSEKSALARAEADAAQKAAELADLLKSKRQPELDALVAARDKAAAALDLARIDWERSEKLLKTKAVSQAEGDARRAAFAQTKAQLEEAEAALATGRLSLGRDDAIQAAGAALQAASAARAEAQWSLDQKEVSAPAGGFVFDTLYRPGEHIAAGQPVVSLLPPENIKVRFFVPEPLLTRLHPKTLVRLQTTGQADSLPAHVSYISPKAEYTPPQLFNRDNREKLLYMIEAVPEKTPEALHPGQPVDVLLPDQAAP